MLNLKGEHDEVHFSKTSLSPFGMSSSQRTATVRNAPMGGGRFSMEVQAVPVRLGEGTNRGFIVLPRLRGEGCLRSQRSSSHETQSSLNDDDYVLAINLSYFYSLAVRTSHECRTPLKQRSPLT